MLASTVKFSKYGRANNTIRPNARHHHRSQKNRHQHVTDPSDTQQRALKPQSHHQPRSTPHRAVLTISNTTTTPLAKLPQ